MPKIIHGLNFAVASPPPFSLECIFACTVPEIDTKHFKFENLFVKHGGSPKIWFCNVIVFISEVDFREKKTGKIDFRKGSTIYDRMHWMSKNHSRTTK